MNNLLIVGLLIYLLGKVIETGILYLILSLTKEEVNVKNMTKLIKNMIKGQIQLTVLSAMIIAVIVKLSNL